VKALNSLLKIILILAVVLMISVFYPDVFDLDEGGSGSVSYASGFNINQSAGTSQGTVKRHIDISSPWSGGYVYEDMTIKGRVEITESFTMGTPVSGDRDFFDDDIFSDKAKQPAASAAGSNPEAGTASNPGSGKTAVAANASSASSESGIEAVLGISILAVPGTWLELF